MTSVSLLQRLAQRGGGGERGERQGGGEQRAEQQQMGPRGKAADRRLDGGDAEDQHGNVERQDEQREQHAAAPRAQTQRRADGADQAQGGRAERHAEKECRITRGIEMQEERQHLRHQGQRHQGKRLEAAILVIGLEDAFERQESGEERRHPDDAGRNARQERRLGADAEGEKNDGQDEERHHRRGIAALAQGQAQVARDEPAEGAHAARRGAKSRSERGMAFSIAKGVWVERTTRPPLRRCSAMTAARSACASASSPVAGSSRSQSGAGLATRRASARRRRCPAERSRQGERAKGASRNRASAASTPRLSPCMPAQKASVSATVSTGFTAS